MNANEVKDLHHRSGLSTSSFAKVLGIAPSTVWVWEAGKSNIKDEYVQRLERFRNILNTTGQPPKESEMGYTKRTQAPRTRKSHKRQFAALPHQKPESINTPIIADKVYTVIILEPGSDTQMFSRKVKDRSTIMEVIERIL